MYDISQNPALNYNSKEAQIELRRMTSHLPSKAEVYLIGGSVRNALFREFHQTVLTQRDYAQVVVNGSAEYRRYLAELGFVERQYPSRQDEQVVFSKALNNTAQLGDSYTNWLVFDMHTVDGTTIEDNEINNVCFTINGCAIKASELYNTPWETAVIQILPTAVQDIKTNS